MLRRSAVGCIDMPSSEEIPIRNHRHPPIGVIRGLVKYADSRKVQALGNKVWTVVKRIVSIGVVCVDAVVGLVSPIECY